jgi:hypothetical protein
MGLVYSHPNWTEGEKNCLLKFLRDADREGELRAIGAKPEA